MKCIMTYIIAALSTVETALLPLLFRYDITGTFPIRVDKVKSYKVNPSPRMRKQARPTGEEISGGYYIFHYARSNHRSYLISRRQGDISHYICNYAAIIYLIAAFLLSPSNLLVLINPFSFSPDDPEPLQARVNRALIGNFPVAKGRLSPLFIPLKSLAIR